MPSDFHYEAFTLEIETSKLKKTFTYTLPVFFKLINRDTVWLNKKPLVVTYIKKDSILEIDGRKFKPKKIGTDSIIHVPSIIYEYKDDENYPDDEILYVFHPKYGLLRTHCRAWFWDDYYYINDKKYVNECTCPNPKY
ncbi:MAG TPA: hypothetical protein VK177_09250 [Flavobacteriales bacterium]|nr:hypothetical protein [Flavobacteriales bacterium]